MANGVRTTSRTLPVSTRSAPSPPSTSTCASSPGTASKRAEAGRRISTDPPRGRSDSDISTATACESSWRLPSVTLADAFRIM